MLASVAAWRYIASFGTYPPSLDWANFDSNHIDKNLSKNDPFGSKAIIFWQNAKGSYTVKKLTDYAAARGWKLRGTKPLDSFSAKLYNGMVYQLVDTMTNAKHTMTPAWLMKGATEYDYFFKGSRGRKKKHGDYQSHVFVSYDESSACVYPIDDDS